MVRFGAAPTHHAYASPGAEGQYPCLLPRPPYAGARGRGQVRRYGGRHRRRFSFIFAVSLETFKLCITVADISHFCLIIVNKIRAIYMYKLPELIQK